MACKFKCFRNGSNWPSKFRDMFSPSLSTYNWMPPSRVKLSKSIRLSNRASSLSLYQYGDLSQSLHQSDQRNPISCNPYKPPAIAPENWSQNGTWRWVIRVMCCFSGSVTVAFSTTLDSGDSRLVMVFALTGLTIHIATRLPIKASSHRHTIQEEWPSHLHKALPPMPTV